MRLIVILAAIFAVALPSRSAWDARFFPTPDSPVREWDGTNVTFAQDVIVTQMIAAVNERWWALNERAWPMAASLMNNPERQMRKPEVVLALCKSGVVAMCSAVYEGGYVYSDGYLDMTRTINGPNDLIFWSKDTILQAAGLPTNFFEVTPVRNLMEHTLPDNASWTDSIGHGWDGLYRVLNLLTHTYKDRGALRVAEEEWCASGYSVIRRDNAVFQTTAYSYDAAWSARGSFDGEDGDWATVVANFGSSDIVRSAVRLFTNTAAFPQYLLYETSADVWESPYGAININPGPSWLDPFRGLDCGNGTQEQEPNKDTLERFSELCSLTNLTFVLTETVSSPMSQGGYLLLAGEGERRASLGSCGAVEILADMNCTYSSAEGPDTDADTCPYDDTDGGFFAADQRKEASIYGIVVYNYIINWGFYQR